MGAVGESLLFNNPHSGDSNTHQQVGTQERSEDINFNNPSNGFSGCEEVGARTY